MDIRMERQLAALEKMRDALAKYWRWLATAAVCAVAVALCVHIMLGSNGAVAFRQKKADCRSLEKETAEINKENTDLQARVKLLQEEDRDTIEREAREQLRYAKPGEFVYFVPEQSAAKPPANAAAENKAKP
jgi:cell division protein FtsB